jgi:hypothetical protein
MRRSAKNCDYRNTIRFALANSTKIIPKINSLSESKVGMCIAFKRGNRGFETPTNEKENCHVSNY